MKTAIAILALSAGLMLTSHAVAQSERAQVLATIPESVTVEDYYKQNVYDKTDTKIGEVVDVLVAPNGTIAALMVDVGGGYIGGGQGAKDVAVGFRSIKHTEKNNKVYLTMDVEKEALRNAPGFKYNKTTTKWDPDSRR